MHIARKSIILDVIFIVVFYDIWKPLQLFED